MYLERSSFLIYRSVVTSLLELSDDVIESINSRSQTDVYLDFTKAFDYSDHRLLSYKLFIQKVHNGPYKNCKSFRFTPSSGITLPPRFGGGRGN